VDRGHRIRLGVDLISDDTVFRNVPNLAIRTIAAT
jgi:hypothetical protein